MMQIITLAVIAAVLVAMVVTGKILRWRAPPSRQTAQSDATDSAARSATAR